MSKNPEEERGLHGDEEDLRYHGESVVQEGELRKWKIISVVTFLVGWLVPSPI